MKCNVGRYVIICLSHLCSPCTCLAYSGFLGSHVYFQDPDPQSRCHSGIAAVRTGSNIGKIFMCLGQVEDVKINYIMTFLFKEF